MQVCMVNKKIIQLWIKRIIFLFMNSNVWCLIQSAGNNWFNDIWKNNYTFETEKHMKELKIHHFLKVGMTNPMVGWMHPQLLSLGCFRDHLTPPEMFARDDKIFVRSQDAN